jgi:hypothetical protein
MLVFPRRFSWCFSPQILAEVFPADFRRFSRRFSQGSFPQIFADFPADGADFPATFVTSAEICGKICGNLREKETAEICGKNPCENLQGKTI